MNFSGIAYDANGNTLTMVNSSGTTTYAWDYENRLTGVTLPGSAGTVSFKYDPFGRRIYKSSSSGTLIYAYDGDNLIEETNSSGTAVARYTQGLNIDEPLAMLRSSATSYYQVDGLGSVTSLSNAAGAAAANYTYDSFGNLVASSGSIVNNFRYTGREWDPETSLYYYRARYYDPSAGRFMNEDDLGFGGGIDFYVYAKNAGVNFRDPSGNDVWLEGPSGNEPQGHLSINVGDPNGHYDSYSFGIDGNGLEGEVYKDTSLGGEILPDYYRRTTPAEDALTKAMLEAQLGNKSTYSPWNTCRNFSLKQFKQIQDKKIGVPAAPPKRRPAPRTKPWTVPFPLSTSASDALNFQYLFPFNPFRFM